MKKFIISSATLKQALEKLSLAVSPSVLPALNDFYCTVNKGSIVMVTSDTELTISVTVEAETEGYPFDILLPFKYIHDIINKIKEQPVTIEHPSTRKAKLITDDDLFELNSLNKFEDFPKLPAAPKKPMITLGSNFIPLLEKALLTCSKDSLRPALNHVCLDIEKDGITVVSTDTHVLFTHKINISAGTKDQLLLSPKFAKALHGMGDQEVSWTAKQMIFKSGSVIVWSTRSEMVYVDYKAVLPKNNPNLELDRAGLVEKMNLSCLTTSEKKDTTIVLKDKEGFVFFITPDLDLERNNKLKLPGTYSGDVASININAKKMLTMLKQIDVEKVLLHIYSPSKAVLLTSAENPEYLGLIMPLMTNQ